MKKIYILLLAFSINNLSSQNCSFICNGDFDNPFMVTTSGLTVNINCWQTTASDGLMEIWGTGYNGVTSYNGIQHIELNATQAATMFQNFFVATPGTNLTLRFAHRARANIGQTDTMLVEIGPVGGPYTSMGKYGDGPSAWGYYTTNYIVPALGNYSIRFTPTWWGWGNIGVGNFLDAVSVCLEQPAGVTELISDSESLAYPNPANENISIKFENDAKDNFSLNVYDQQGRLVKTMNEITTNEVKLEKGNLNSGLYFFTLTSNQKNLQGKFNFIN